jgi:hypothetical protein
MIKSLPVARRPEIGKQEDIHSQEDLKAIGRSLSFLSVSAVRDFYERAYNQCRITGRDFPPARAIQELVTAWKQLRKWRR